MNEPRYARDNPLTPCGARSPTWNPGLVDIIDWRPEPGSAPDPLGGDVTRYSMLAAVGRR